MVRLPVTVSDWICVFSCEPLYPKFTVVIPVVWMIEPIVNVVAVIVKYEPAVEWPIFIVLLCPAVREIPKFKV